MAFSPIPDQSLPSGASSLSLALGNFFNIDAITGTLVRLVTNTKGKTNALFVELFDQPNSAANRTTPLTAANFLGYVNRGDYDGVIFHRLVQNFVLQGGGFRAPSTASVPLGFFPPEAIPQGPTVANEPGNSNIRGTVAMAKLGNDPNSATNQFFFNLSDNRSILDNQNGGFTAFGRLTEGSLALLDRLAAAPVFSAGSPFEELPLQGYKPAKPSAAPRPVQTSNYLAIRKAERSGEFSYKVKAKGATASVDPISGELQLRWSTPPSKATTVTVMATSVLDPSQRFKDSFLVSPAPLPSALLLGTETLF